MPEHFPFLLAAIFLSAMLQASTGFGFSILTTPFLLFFFSAPSAIQINMILSLLLSIGMLGRIKVHVEKPLLWRFVVSSTAALPFGILLALLDAGSLRFVVGVTLLVLTLLLICRLKFARSKLGDYLTGGLSGLMTTSIGMPGPPLLVYLSGADVEKSVLRSTALSYFVFVYIGALALHFLYNGMMKETWLSVAVLAPAVAVGTLFGHWLFRWFSPKSFRIVLYCVLAATGIITVLQGAIAASAPNLQTQKSAASHQSPQSPKHARGLFRHSRHRIETGLVESEARPHFWPASAPRSFPVCHANGARDCSPASVIAFSSANPPIALRPVASRISARRKPPSAQSLGGVPAE